MLSLGSEINRLRTFYFPNWTLEDRLANGAHIICHGRRLGGKLIPTVVCLKEQIWSNGIDVGGNRHDRKGEKIV
jgi:hypothetical protein